MSGHIWSHASPLRSAACSIHCRGVGRHAVRRRTQGRVTPGAFTHGTSRQRESRLAVGCDSGDPKRYDTFSGGI
ncbi:neutral zinc metallopeptidase [Nonomuraea jabiensis]|uniref:neutral zinc metallopeptidase n=1 Tax=Nonomuraea jabiensis TaxID=882448 RepID=UPI00369A4993